MSFQKPQQTRDGREDPYEVLGLPRDASVEQIKSAYRKLALKYHPDKQTSVHDKEKCNETFTKIANAYEILSDERRRATYDRNAHGGRSEQQHSQYQPFSGMFSGFRGSFNHDFFSETDPFEVFRRAFSEEMRSSTSKRANDGEFFQDPFFNRRFGQGHDLFQGFFNQNDDVMNMMNSMRREDGGLRGQSHFYSSTSFGGGGRGVSESVSTTTRIINGKRQTVTERTVTRPDGTVERHTETSGDDDFPLLPHNNNGSSGVTGYIDSSESQRRTK